MAEANHQRTFDHVPRLVVVAVDVERGDVHRRIAAPTRISPLDDDQRGSVRADLMARERRREELCQLHSRLARAGHGETVARFPQHAHKDAEGVSPPAEGVIRPY